MSEATPPLFQGSPLGKPGEEESTARAVRTMFGAVAPRYDFLNHFLSLGRDIAWRRATAAALRVVLSKPGSRAVDLCCGTGDLTLALARQSSGTVVGADFCHPMLDRARKKSRTQVRASFVEADALLLPFPDVSLDLLAMAFGFRNLANYSRGIREIRRVLRPGGTAAILEFSRVRWPVLGPLFRTYFRHVLPRLGTWISGVPGPYQYLPDSVSQFPDQESLAGFLREEGFTNVRYTNFTGGIAALHLGEKA